MAKIGIFYGSTSGHTAKAAELISEILSDDHDVEVVNMEDSDLDEVLSYDNLLLGSSTWGQGDLQNDWRDPFTEMEDADFSGKTVALFGTGDAHKHGEHFVSALGILHDKITAQGGKVVGYVSPEGYEFKASLALKNGKFVGLPLDEVNEAHKSHARIEAWLKSMEGSFK